MMSFYGAAAPKFGEIYVFNNVRPREFQRHVTRGVPNAGSIPMPEGLNLQRQALFVGADQALTDAVFRAYGPTRASSVARQLVNHYRPPVIEMPTPPQLP